MQPGLSDLPEPELDIKNSEGIGIKLDSPPASDVDISAFKVPEASPSGFGGFTTCFNGVYLSGLV